MLTILLPVKQPAKYETCSFVGCDAMYSGGLSIRAAALTDKLPLIQMSMISKSCDHTLIYKKYLIILQQNVTYWY
jgi:hypothetical protein